VAIAQETPEEVQPCFYIDSSGLGESLHRLLRPRGRSVLDGWPEALHRPHFAEVTRGRKIEGVPSLSQLVNLIVTAYSNDSLRVLPGVAGWEGMLKALESIRPDDEGRLLDVPDADLVTALGLTLYSIGHGGTTRPPRYQERSGAIVLTRALSSEPY